MKIGDKLLCKEYFKWGNFFGKGKYYEITYISQNGITMLDENDNRCLLYYDSLQPFHDSSDALFIWNYFYTPNEIRKKKLKKLNRKWWEKIIKYGK